MKNTDLVGKTVAWGGAYCIVVACSSICQGSVIVFCPAYNEWYYLGSHHAHKIISANKFTSENWDNVLAHPKRHCPEYKCILQQWSDIPEEIRIRELLELI